MNTPTQAMSGARPASDGNNHSSGGAEPSSNENLRDAAPIETPSFGLLTMPVFVPRDVTLVKFDGHGKQVKLIGRPKRTTKEIAEQHRAHKEFLDHRRKNRIKHIKFQMNKSRQRIKRIQSNIAKWDAELAKLVVVKP